MKTERIIPTVMQNGVAVDAPFVEHGNRIVYLYPYTKDGKDYFAGKAYIGKQRKCNWHLSFSTEAEREECIQSFFAMGDKVQARKDAIKAERKAESAIPHSLKVGEIIYNSWGWEQTNVDFYEIVKVSAHFVWVQKLKATTNETSFMAGNTTALPGTASGEITRHKVSRSGSVKFECGSGMKWDGNALGCSWYA